VVKLWHLSLNVVIPGFRAFSCTGVDYFGPILAKLSLDSFIEGALSERCTATEVPTSYSPKELREEFAVGIIPDSRVATSGRRGVALFPLSPSSGGAWEILVKSVKRILHSLAGERALDDEAIHSLLVNVMIGPRHW